MDTLNEAQRQAVTLDDGAALVLAGAGSGKTRVIVERLAWLVGERGVDPRNLLAVTFTNRAAGEMRARVAQRLGLERLAAWVGTFHGFGLYLLRREIDKLGRSKNFTVFDAADQLALMKRLVQDLPAKWTTVAPRPALWWISRLKQSLDTPETTPESKAPEDPTYRELWTRYHGALARMQAVDFDDLMVLTARLLSDHEAVRARYQHRFRHVLVDEYQDTNRAQYVIARHVSGGAGNLFVVGDEDQGIYSWRGADIRNVLDFERDYPGARVIRLEQNYRSTGAILAAANAVVAHNEKRLGKTLWTAADRGEPVRYYNAPDAEAEARFVVDALTAGDAAPDETAILYRTHAQARLLEEALLRKRVPYRVLDSTQFYGRKEVKDLLAYLRLLVNPADDVSLRRVLNVPPRGLGSVTMEHIEAYAASRGSSLFDVLRDVEHDQTLASRPRTAAAEFVALVDDLALQAKQGPVASVVDALLVRTAYRDYVQRADEKDFRTRLEVVDEFVSACAQFDERSGAGGLMAFLQELALLSDVDSYDAEAPAVVLMTCHSTKGLEFDQVFLIGLEEGLLPHASALESDDEIEEERRLCYVAMTRARRRLTLSTAKTRLVYGDRQPRQPSRFLREIPEKELEVVGGGGARRGAPKPRPDAVQTDTNRLKTGTRVRHATFGRGVVLFTKGSGKKMRARIRFDTGRSRELMVSMAPLEILDGGKAG
jgi:ATP-dependent DNA helicase UvrD/PcrA